MNEDDTFEALRRTPIDTLQQLMSDTGIFESAIYEKFSETEIAFLKKHGWTVKEFRKSWMAKALKDIPNVHIYFWWEELLKSIENE